MPTNTQHNMKNRSTLSLVVMIYTAFIIVWLTARLLFFDRFWLLALPNTVAEYLFVPLPLLLIVSGWQRDWTSLAKLGIPTVAFVALFGHLFWPPLPPQETNEHQLITVMSFNVLGRNRAHEAIVASIQFSKPDIVGFQELRPVSAAALVEQLDAEYPYSTLQSSEAGQSAGLLSKFPIESFD